MGRGRAGRQETYYAQGNEDKVYSKHSIRNYTGKKTVNWHLLKWRKKNKYQPRIIYSGTVSLKKSRRKDISKYKKLKDFIANTLALQEMLKEVLQAE